MCCKWAGRCLRGASVTERGYYINQGLTRRVWVRSDCIVAQIRHPLYYSWESVCRFATTELYRATRYAQSAETWPAIPKPAKAQKLGQPM